MSHRYIICVMNIQFRRILNQNTAEALSLTSVVRLKICSLKIAYIVTPADAIERSVCGTVVSLVQWKEIPASAGDQRESHWGMTLQTNSSGVWL